MEQLRLWLWCVGGALAVSVGTFWGIGGAVHWRFYHRRAQAAEWKVQPARWLSPPLARHAFWLGSANILFGSLLGGSFVWHLLGGGWSRIYFDAGSRSWPYLIVSPLVVLFLIDAGLYYSHRLLHHKVVFRFVHRWHHRYVAPTVFTTTAMHPLEFVIFMAMLILPALVVPIHAGAYAAVIAYTYLIGMIDHSGIRVAWRLPLHADNRFHDDHHVYFHCNYGHHTALWDRWHGTVKKPGGVYGEHSWGGEEEEGAHVELSRAQ